MDDLKDIEKVDLKMQKPPSMFEKFKQFVCKQEEWHPVNHEGWEYCAIGEFSRSIGKHHSEVLEVLEPAEPYILAALNVGHAPGGDEDDEAGELATYGNLCEFIKRHEGGTLDEYTDDQDEYGR